jgi:drug/metabolite transporter (DMT)-like permease
MTKRVQAELGLLLNALIWGFTFTTVKNALVDASPVLFVAVRFTLAGVALLLLYSRKVDRRLLLPGSLVGLLLFAGYGFQTAGLRFTTASKSAFITGLAIPMVPLLSSIVYKRRPRPAEVAGVLAATFGMGLMTLQDVHLHLNPGDVLTVLCAAAFAGHIVGLGYFSNWAIRRGLGFESLAVWQIVTAAVFAFVSFSWLDRLAGVAPHWQMSTRLGIALAITGLLATAFAFTLQTWAQRYTTPTRTALIYALEPVFAWAFSWLLTGELLSRRAALGAVLILAGILLVEMKRTDAGLHPIVSVSTPEV